MFAIIRVLDDTRNGIAHTATRHIGIVGALYVFPSSKPATGNIIRS